MEKVERFLRPEQVKDRVGFEDTWIRAQVKQGHFPAPILIGTGKVKRRIWRESVINEWIAAHTAERSDASAKEAA